MSAHMDKLMMTIGLIDQATAPLKGIQSTITQTADTGRIGWEKMVGGTAGLVAAGFAVQSALMPAIEMDRVLGEVKSLGVVDADLQQLQQTALGFSAEYGKSATEVVEAAYDIKSAFGNINGDELADITKSSAVLAAATKADTATITDYMGTMYGVFKNQADDMGTGIWSKQVAGMTARSVEMFKTTGKGMSDAFTSVGANATSAGISMNEQMAILGTLQATMSGSEAGTKYKSFLDGVGKAQDKLNLSFTDSQGAMLPMHDILGKLKNEFGDTLDVAESDALKNAFGSAEAVSMIKLLMADTDGLAASIETLGDVKGMGKAESMAGAMTDQWERLDASWYAIRAGVFGLVLPAINGVVGGMADGIGSILEWTQLFPNITAYLGYAALAIIGGAGALAAWNLIVGLSTLVTAGWASAVGVMSGVMTLVSTGLTWMKGAFIGLNMIMAANPVLLIVAGIVALGIAVIGIIVYWDELTAALNKIWIFNQIGQMFKAVGSSVMSVINDLVLAWDIFTLALLNTGFMQGIMSGFNALSNFFSGLFDGYVSIASGAWALIGAGVDALLLPFQVVFTSIKAFFSLLIDGPAAALAVLGTIPALFTGIADSVMSGWQLIASGVSTVVSHLFTAILFLAQPFIFIGQQAMRVFDLMAQGWGSFTDGLVNNDFVQSLIARFDSLSGYISGLFSGFVAIGSGAWELIGAGVSALLLPFQMVFTSIKAFFSLLVDGPAAALAVLGTIPALFTGITDSVMSGWQLIASGVSTVVNHMVGYILFLAQPFMWVGQQAMRVFGLMAQSWADFMGFLGDLSVFELLGDGINWLIEKINMIPGIEIDPVINEPLIPDVDSLNINEQKANSEKINRPISNYLQGTQAAQVPTYGYMPQMAKAMQGNGGKSTHTGDIHIKQEQPFTRAQLHEWNEMDTP